MKLLTLRYLSLCLFLLLPVPLAADSTDDDHKTLLVFGDSLSAAYGIREDQGWVTLLARRIADQGLAWRVVNTSVSGETSAGGLSRLPAALAAHQPDLVILELGGNDGLRGLPLKALRSNLDAMIDLAKESGAEVLLAGIQIPPNYGPRYTEPFFALFHDLAEQQETAFLPFLLEGIADRSELMQGDGIHPRASAQGMILDNVWSVLQPMLSEED